MAGSGAFERRAADQVLRMTWGLVMVFTTSCYPHVQLSLPPPGASLQARSEAYGKLRPVEMHSTTVVADGVVSTSSRNMDYLKLGDATLVR
jgi:hypothetical protein